MDDATRQSVRRRAGECCEYCHLPEAGHDERFSIHHVVARKHGGDSVPDNLALCCLRCNLHKGTDLTGIDPDSRRVVSLFHPRQQVWQDHFHWNGPVVIGRTPTGRATVTLLQMNSPVRLREALMAEGLMKPT